MFKLHQKHRRSNGYIQALGLLLLFSFGLLSGCVGDDDTNTNTNTNTNTVESLDETSVFEGFKYLNTAKDTLPQQREAALLNIEGIKTASCGYAECNFTLDDGREAAFLYPAVVDVNNLGTASASLVTENASTTLKSLHENVNVLSALNENKVCPISKRAAIWAPIVDQENKLVSDFIRYEIGFEIKPALEALGYEVFIEFGKGADLESFGELFAEDFGIVFIYAHGNYKGTLLSHELIPLCVQKKECSPKTKDIATGLITGKYYYAGMFSEEPEPSVDTYLGILPKWWEENNVAKTSEDRFYFFQGCQVFNTNSPLRRYFETHNLNGLGLNDFGVIFSVPYPIRVIESPTLEFYISILKSQIEIPLSSILTSINSTKEIAGNICITEGTWWIPDVFQDPFRQVSASQCAVALGDPNLYLNQNNCPDSSTPQNAKPVATNIIAPTSVEKGKSFNLQVAYSDADGNTDVVKARVLVLAIGSQYESNISNGNGLHTMQMTFDTETAGQYQLEIYLIDSTGNQSNRLTHNITVTEPASNESTGMIDYKVRVVESINGQQVPVVGVYVSLFYTTDGFFVEINGGGKTTDTNGRVTFNLLKGRYSAGVIISSIYVPNNSVTLDNSKEVVLVLSKRQTGGNANLAISGTYNGTKTYMTGIETGTKYDISMNLSETSGMLTGTYTVRGFGGSSLFGERNGTSVTFTTKPAGNPSCSHSFNGTINASTISGSFATTNNCNGSGSWNVVK